MMSPMLWKKFKNRSDIKPKVYLKASRLLHVIFCLCIYSYKRLGRISSIKQGILFEIAEIIENHNAEIAYPTSTVFINKD